MLSFLQLCVNASFLSSIVNFQAWQAAARCSHFNARMLQALGGMFMYWSVGLRSPGYFNPSRFQTILNYVVIAQTPNLALSGSMHARGRFLLCGPGFN
jgi:hypothetical protein